MSLINPNENQTKNIVSASNGKRTSASLVDAIILLLLTFVCFLITNKISNNTSKVKESKITLVDRYIESGLFKYNVDEDGNEDRSNMNIKTFDSYKDYQNMFYNYYLTYLKVYVPTNYKNDLPKNFDANVYTNYWFNVFILGQEDVKSLYIEDKNYASLPSLIKEKGKELFTYKLDESNQPLYDEVALPKACNNDSNKTLSEEENKKLISYFYNSDANNGDFVYYYVVNDFSYMPFISKAYKSYYVLSQLYPMVIAYSISYVILFIIIPLCFRNGETIGKFIFKICLVNEKDYQINRLQVIPRALIMLFLPILIVSFLGLNMFSLGFVVIAILLSYMIMRFSYNHKAIHDYIAFTKVIDKRESNWFKSKNDEDLYNENLKKVIVDASNIIENETNDDISGIKE